MRFKVGDKVRVRGDLVVGSVYQGQKFVASMAHNRGLEKKVAKVLGDFYILEDSGWTWADEMLESLKPVQVGDIIVLRDGAEAKVLEVFENTFVRSYRYQFDKACEICSFEQIEINDWKVKGKEDNKELVELTLSDIAEKFGVDVDKLRIKEEE